MKTFSTMKTNVQNFLKDTTSAFGTLAGIWINQRYQDAWNRTIWTAAVNDDYTITTVADQATYDLPLDFREELFVANITDGEELVRYKEQFWWKERHSAYLAGSIDSSTNPSRYVILKEKVNSTNTGFGVIKIDPPCSEANKTFAMPYHRKFPKLLNVTGTCTTNTEYKIIASASTFITDEVEAGMVVKNTDDNTYGVISSVDSETQLTMETDLCPDGDEGFTIQNEVIIPDLDWIIEMGAFGEAYAYKNSFAKADYYNQRYEHELAKRIGQEKRSVNQLYQVISSHYRMQPVRRLTGDQSYDTV